MIVERSPPLINFSPYSTTPLTLMGLNFDNNMFAMFQQVKEMVGQERKRVTLCLVFGASISIVRDENGMLKYRKINDKLEGRYEQRAI